MRRLLLLAAVALVAAFPASAQAGVFDGVLIAKDPKRQTIVTASPSGAVRTVHVGRAIRLLKRGQRLSINATRLRDGTYAGRRIRVNGRAKHARIRGVVVKHQRSLNRYLVSAGGSTFAVKARGMRRFSLASAKNDNEVAPGTQVIVNVTVTIGGLAAGTVTPVGQAGTVQLTGICLGISDGNLQIAVLGQGLVNVAIPAGTTPPTCAPGQLVTITATPGPNNTLTFVALQPATSGATVVVNVTVIVNVNGGGGHHDHDHDDDDDDDDDDD